MRVAPFCGYQYRNQYHYGSEHSRRSGPSPAINAQGEGRREGGRPSWDARRGLLDGRERTGCLAQGADYPPSRRSCLISAGPRTSRKRTLIPYRRDAIMRPASQPELTSRASRSIREAWMRITTCYSTGTKEVGVDQSSGALPALD